MEGPLWFEKLSIASDQEAGSIGTVTGIFDNANDGRQMIKLSAREPTNNNGLLRHGKRGPVSVKRG
jgi:hypothetical protein